MTFKYRASTHDLKKVSTTVEYTRGSSKFSALIKSSAGSYKDPPSLETTEEMTIDRQPTEAGESSVVLDNSPSQSAKWLPRDM